MTKEEKQLRTLKWIVKILGIILVFGMIAVLTIATVKLVGKIKLRSGEQAQVSCVTPLDVKLPRSGEIMDMTHHKHQLSVTAKQDGLYTLFIFDSCTGALKQEIKISSPNY